MTKIRDTKMGLSENLIITPNIAPSPVTLLTPDVCPRCLSADCTNPDDKSCSDNVIIRLRVDLSAAQARLAEAEKQTVYGIHTEAEVRALRATERAEQAETTLAAIRAWAERQVASVATDKVETGYLDGSSLTAKVCAEDVLALLDAPPSPENG